MSDAVCAFEGQKTNVFLRETKQLFIQLVIQYLYVHTVEAIHGMHLILILLS